MRDRSVLRRNLGLVAVYCVLAAFVLYPILSVTVPALTDYPNHLARMHVLATIDRSPELAGFYSVDWAPIPYLAMDMMFLGLRWIGSIYDAGKIFVAICLVLSPLSVGLLHYVVHRRLSFVPVVMFLFSYNFLFSWGFFNYIPALSFAVLLFAIWVATAGWARWPRAAMFCILALGLYFSHLVAFAAYCVAVGGYELGRAVRAGWAAWRRTGLDWCAAAVQVVPAIAMNIMVPLDTGFVGPVITRYGTLSDRMEALQSPFLFWGGRGDPVTEIFVCIVVVYCVLTRSVRLAPDIWPAVLAVAIVAMIIPNVLWGTYGLDFRLPIMVVMLIVGGISTTPKLGVGPGRIVLGGVVVLTAARCLSIATTMQFMDRQVAVLRELVAPMPRGMRVLVIHGPATGHDGPKILPRALAHSGLVALIDRDAFIPDLFANLGTVHVRPSMLGLASTNGLWLNASHLIQGFGRLDDPQQPTLDGNGGRIFWLGWEHKFDYLLVIHFGASVANLPGPLRLVGHNAVGDLYRIIPQN